MLWQPDTPAGPGLVHCPGPFKNHRNPSCSAASGTGPGTDNFTYIWKTDQDATGCKELIVKLVDGSFHRALFQFRP
ncbi:PxKF domain-containing protein [Arthrobacter oryzae]|uniref:PxKF domain-containing protein n=1 Tax=Arthrobacter oryzae TaxID=409290 RepID=UPI001ABF3555